jgi:hypothetical protein
VIPATLEPYALAIAAAGGLLVGAAGMGWFQQTRIDALKVEAREAAVSSEERRQTAQRAADAASATVAGLSTDLAAAHRLQRVVEIEVEKEIVRVASPARACLGPAAVSVLQRSDSRPPRASQSASQPAGAGLRPPADPDGSASEAAVARWMSACRSAYWSLMDRDEAKTDVLRSLERAGLITVVPD